MRNIELEVKVHATTGLMAVTAPEMPGFVLFAETPADAENRIERAMEAFMLDAFGQRVVCHLLDQPPRVRDWTPVGRRADSENAPPRQSRSG